MPWPRADVKSVTPVSESAVVVSRTARRRRTLLTPRRTAMAIKEYEPGTAFPGVMGRTVGESSPAWPRPLRAKPGAPNVLFIVLDDSGLRAPRLLRLADPDAEPRSRWPPAACATTTCTPRRSARRAASCMLTGRNHHSNAMACITEGATGYPGSNGLHPVRERLPVGDAARRTATTRSRSASGT